MKRYSGGVLLSIFLCGCDEVPPSSHISMPMEKGERSFQNMEKFWKRDLTLYSSESVKILPALWYGTLSVLNPFPYERLEAENGFIQTHWITLPEYPGERFKMRVMIIPSSAIHVQCVNVIVFHEILEKNTWISAEPSRLLALKLKHLILLKARSFGRKSFS